MRTLDLNTIGVIGLIMHACLALVMVLTYFTRKTYPGFRSWTWALICWFTFCVVMFFRPGLGDGVALTLGTLFFYLFALLLHDGMVRFYALGNERSRMGLDAVVAALGLGVVVWNYLFFRDGDVRVFTNSLVGAFLLFRAGLEPLRSPEGRHGFIQPGLSLSLVTLALLLAVRAVSAPLGVDYPAEEPQDPMYKLALVLGLIIDVVLVYGFISMVHQRLERELLSAQERLRELADTDLLTGLFNRRGFLDAAIPSIRRSERYGRAASLIILDLDHFKRINDTHGHAAGDEMLSAVAESLREVTRDSDLLARWGGEEFAVLMPETDLAGAGQCAERMRRRLHDLRPASNLDVWTTASFGVALLDGDGLDGLVARADAQLYKAKREGRDRVCVEG